MHVILHLEVQSNALYTSRSYASYNYSAPRLPKGLRFSSMLRAITNLAYDANGIFINIVDGVTITQYWNLGSAVYTGLSCPYLLLASEEVDDPSFHLECECCLTSTWNVSAA